MAIKMRILYAASGKMATLAAKLHAEYQLGPNAVDNIPPAYSCDKERIVFLGLSVKDEPDDSVKRFLGELWGDAAFGRQSALPTVVMSLMAARYGADLHRVHDVAELSRSLVLSDSVSLSNNWL